MKNQDTTNISPVNGEYMNPFIKCYQQKLVKKKLKLKKDWNWNKQHLVSVSCSILYLRRNSVKILALLPLL